MSHYSDEEAHSTEQLPPPAYYPPETFILENATSQIEQRNARESSTLRLELGRILEEIVHTRLGSSHQPELLQAFEIWKHNILQRLEGTTITPDGQATTHNRGFNYYYEPNWKSIVKYFEKLRDRKDWRGRLVKIVNENGPTKDFEVDRILTELKLDSVVQGRTQLLQYLLSGAYRGLYLHGERREQFEANWARLITKKILLSVNNLQIDAIWYRVEAVLNFVKDDVPKKQGTWRQLKAKERIKAFCEKYKVEGIVAEMSLLSGNPDNATSNRVRNFVGRRSGRGESSQASLSHGRRAFVVESRRE